MLRLVTLCAAVLAAGNVHAQDSLSAGQHIKKAAQKVGNKTAELASKGKSAVIDKVYKGKQGPAGETIYINNKSQYYSVDKKGHKHFFTESELKDKS